METRADQLRLVYCGILFALGACAPAPNGSAEQYKSKTWQQITATDRKECNAKGGRYDAVGMTGAPSCVVPFADAGKVCRDSSECLGQCTVELDYPVNAKPSATSGRCDVNSAHFGCFAEIKDGVEQSGQCVD